MGRPVITNKEHVVSPFLINATGFLNTKNLIESLGGNYAAICSMAGIPSSLQLNNSGPLTIKYAAGLYDFCAHSLNADNFGLQLSKYESLSPMGLTTAYMRAGRTLAEVLKDFCKYSEEYFKGIIFYFHQSNNICYVGCEIIFPVRGGHRQIVDYVFGLLCDEIRNICAPYVLPLQSVRFRHKAPRDQSVHNKTFGVRVTYNQNANLLVFGNDVNERILNKYSPEQQARLRPALEAERLAAKPDIVIRIIQSICIKTFDRRHDWTKLAASLALSERTLQRRLSELGTSYGKVCEYFYGNLALQYLQQSDLSVAEIATMLEYADQHSFSKAFTKWHGITPTAVRKLQLASAGAPLPAS